jgi:hypothetical protein
MCVDTEAIKLLCRQACDADPLERPPYLQKSRTKIALNLTSIVARLQQILNVQYILLTKLHIIQVITILLIIMKERDFLQ